MVILFLHRSIGTVIYDDTYYGLPFSVHGKMICLAHDFLLDLKSTNGYVVDKIEGFTIDSSGQGFAVTDNDGVDDSSGETLFFKVDL